MTSFAPRFIGHRAVNGRYSRPVDRHFVHDSPIDFRALCVEAVDPSTRYLVLDVDRTIHFGRNMGELLGWELGAWFSYDHDYLASVVDKRGPGRFLLDPKRPLEASRYMTRGTLAWAYPGLYYLLWGRIATQSRLSQRWRYLAFGAEPQIPVQEIAATAFLHDLAQVPITVARKLMAEMLERYRCDQVIDRADIDWLRQRCPNIEIILSSASPRPVVQTVAADLGITACEYTTLAEDNGYLGAPPRLHRLYMHPRQPRYVTPPSQFSFNAGSGKIERLLARYPDFADPDVVSVGITDTGHHEDASWAQHFTRVVDVNSHTPFAPIVAAASPLREVHSAKLLTRAEKASGELDPRRAGASSSAGMRVFAGADLGDHTAAIVAELELLGHRRHQLAAGLADQLASIDRGRARIVAGLENHVVAYNSTRGGKRRRALRAIYDDLRRHAQLTRERRRRERPLSLLAFHTDELLADSRRRLDPAAIRAALQTPSPALI